MCTLTYYPRGRTGYILTSNRDENTARTPASLPVIRQDGHTRMLMPVDEKGGSWLGISSRWRAACLLNGAFGPHTPQLPYRKSRGLVLLDALRWPDLPSFFRDYPLRGIEPFTLVTVNQKPARQVFTFRWDGRERYLEENNPGQPRIWSSMMLYPENVREAEEKRFTGFLENHPRVDWRDLLDFNLESTYRQKVQRYGLHPIPVLKTTAIASIRAGQTFYRFYYEDLSDGSRAGIRFYPDPHPFSGNRRS